MRFFLGLFFLVCAVLGILQLVNRDDSTPPTWNTDCQYGSDYMMPDGTIVHHSDCD